MRQLPKAIVLYRHLLRESLALKDDAIRYYFTSNIKHRFQISRSCKDPKQHQKSMSEGYAILRMLVRANHGFNTDKQNIIGLAYGCFGPLYQYRLKVRDMRPLCV